MHRIGQGYYYNVYDLGNGRVLKIETSHFHRISKQLKWKAYSTGSKILIILRYPKQAICDSDCLAKSTRIFDFDREIFGNPVFVNRYNYEQDKVIPLGVFFEENPLDDNKRRFDEYISIQHTLWKYGLADTVFNFTLNTGVSFRTNKLICSDFNELTDAREKMEACIKKEKWRTQASIRDLEEGELRDYILVQMKQELSLENLEKLWEKSKISNLL